MWIFVVIIYMQKDVFANNNVSAGNAVNIGQELTITENKIVSTTPATNPLGGLEMETNNIYMKFANWGSAGGGIPTGLTIDLGDNTSNTGFRIRNVSGTKVFQVEGSGSTQTNTMSPWLNMTSDLGIVSGAYIRRYRNLYIGNIDTSGNVDINGNLTVNGLTDMNNDVDISGNLDVSGNVDISGNLDVSGNVGISGNIDICGNVIIGGHLSIADLSANNIDVFNDLNVGGILTADTIKNIDLSGTNIDLATTGMFRLKDNNTGAASNHVIVARADNNEVNFGGYDYTGGVGIIGTPTARNRVIVRS